MAMYFNGPVLEYHTFSKRPLKEIRSAPTIRRKAREMSILLGLFLNFQMQKKKKCLIYCFTPQAKVMVMSGRCLNVV